MFSHSLHDAAAVLSFTTHSQLFIYSQISDLEQKGGHSGTQEYV